MRMGNSRLDFGRHAQSRRTSRRPPAMQQRVETLSAVMTNHS
jgi:hypothetical protein